MRPSPRRPVSSLTIKDSGDVGAEEVLDATKASTVAIEQLTIPVDLLHILKQKDWPALRTLTVEADVTWNSQYLSLPYSFTTLNPLSTVTLFTYGLRSYYSRHRENLLQLRLQRKELIEKLALAFPNATRFRFGKVIEWRRDKEILEGWRPYALSQPLLLELLKTVGYYDETQDVDGFLAALQEKLADT